MKSCTITSQKSLRRGCSHREGAHLSISASAPTLPWISSNNRAAVAVETNLTHFWTANTTTNTLWSNTTRQICSSVSDCYLPQSAISFYHWMLFCTACATQPAMSVVDFGVAQVKKKKSHEYMGFKKKSSNATVSLCGKTLTSWV